MCLMNHNLKRWLIGFLMGLAGVMLAWSGYRGVGLLLVWLGGGIAAYGVVGGILASNKAAKKKD